MNHLALNKTEAVPGARMSFKLVSRAGSSLHFTCTSGSQRECELPSGNAAHAGPAGEDPTEAAPTGSSRRRDLADAAPGLRDGAPARRSDHQTWTRVSRRPARDSCHPVNGERTPATPAAQGRPAPVTPAVTVRLQTHAPGHTPPRGREKHADALGRVRGRRLFRD